MSVYRIEGETFSKAFPRAIDLDAEQFERIEIVACRFNRTGGIYIGNIQARPEPLVIRITGNTFVDIARTGPMRRAGQLVQAIQLNGLHGDNPRKVTPVVDAVIAGNVILNRPGKSDVEDCVNLIGVAGTKAQPIQVHANTIKGAYPTPGQAIADYTGGGIMCDRATEWVHVWGNIVSETTNYGIAIAGGCYNLIGGTSAAQANRIIARGAWNVGLYVANFYADPFRGNRECGNYVRWFTPKNPAHKRNDRWIPAGK